MKKSSNILKEISIRVRREGGKEGGREGRRGGLGRRSRTKAGRLEENRNACHNGRHHPLTTTSLPLCFPPLLTSGQHFGPRPADQAKAGDRVLRARLFGPCHHRAHRQPGMGFTVPSSLPCSFFGVARVKDNVPLLYCRMSSCRTARSAFSALVPTAFSPSLPPSLLPSFPPIHPLDEPPSPAPTRAPRLYPGRLPPQQVQGERRKRERGREGGREDRFRRGEVW